jgi:hypothetical protein
VLVSGGTVLLCFFVLPLFVMMNRFTVVMGRRLVMPGGIMVGLTCGMFHGHESCPFKKSANDRRSFHLERPPEKRN